MADTANQYPNIVARAQDAIAHWDALPAWECYRTLEKFPASREIAQLQRELLVVGFPALTDEMAARVFEKSILDFFRVDVKLKERVAARYTFVGYGAKEEERSRLRQALLQNKERLGAYTVSEWLGFFDKRFKPEQREKTSPLNFLTQSSEVSNLSKVEQGILREILEMYNEYIAREVMDEFDIAAARSNPGGSQKSFRGSQRKKEVPSGSQSLQDLPLLEALSKYHQLAQQPITGEKIRLRTQVEPVRPTLMNWLKYYRSELGIGYHDSVQRGEFLYRSENGRRLSDEERERLSLILKSIEEEFPVPIDTDRSEIVFPETRKASGKVGRAYHSPAPVPSSPIFQKPAPRVRPAEIPVATPLSFHQGGLPRAYAAETASEAPAKIPRVSLPSATEEPDSKFAFRELPKIKGLKPAPAWETGKPQATPNNLSFTSPHVFPAEREAKVNWQREKESMTPPVTPAAPRQIPEKKLSSPAARPVPPLAPRRTPSPPRFQAPSPPNRFNIVPMSYREKNEREK